jgi:hypothetical protein
MIKHLKITFLWFFLMVSFLTGYGQTKTETLKLKYDESIYINRDLVPKSGGTRKGEIRIHFKYQISSRQTEEIEMKLEPTALVGNGQITILDKGGDCGAVIDFYSGKDKNDKKLTASNDFYGENLKKFYTVLNKENYLELRDNFKAGATKFKLGRTDVFTIKIDRNKSSRKIDLGLTLYYGTKFDLEVEIKEIIVTLEIPDFDNEICSIYDSRESKIFEKIKPVGKFEAQFSDIINKSKGEISDFITQIEISKGQIGQYQKLKDEIDKDPLKGMCPKVLTISSKIGNFLSENEPKKYDELIQKLNTRIREIDAPKPKEKEVVQKEPEPVKLTEPVQQKEQPPAVVQTKKETPELSCSEVIKKAQDKLADLKREFTKEALINQIAVINVSIENLRNKTAKSGTSDLIKNELIIGTARINEDNSHVNKRLLYYENEINWIDLKIKERPECKEKELTDNIKELKKTIEDYRNQYSQINSDLDELSNLTSVGNKELKDEIRSIYSPVFIRLLTRFTNMNDAILSFAARFKSEKNSGKYYPKVKKDMQGQLGSFSEQLKVLSNSYDSIIEVADADFLAKLNHTAIWSDTTRDNITKIEQTKNNITGQINRLEEDIAKSIPDKFPWLLIISVSLGVIILIFGARVYYIAFKKRKSKQKVSIGRFAQPQTIKKYGHAAPGPSNGLEDWTESQKVGGITITRVTPENKGKQPVEAGKGLDHVEDQIGIDYREIDLRDYWQDTLVGKVFIHRSAIKKTYKFFLESCSNPDKVLETGGYLIGGWEIDKEDPNKYNVSFEDFIEPGDDAIYGEYQLNFGAKIGVRLEKVIQNYREKMGKEFTLTAWFHSHPAIKIFLSNHDLDVQERLSSQEHKYKLLALVIDPITQENNMSFLTGVFSYKSNGTMNNNAGNLKMINWKQLYEWAISAAPTTIKDYYSIDLEPVCNNSSVSAIYMNDRCITRFSLFLDELQNKPKAQGFFRGEVSNKDVHGKKQVFFKDFVEETEDNINDGHDVVGHFFFTDEPDAKIADLQLQHEKLNHTEVIVLCDNFNKNLWFSTRKEDLSFNRKEDLKKPVSFTEIETWPTRRR